MFYKAQKRPTQRPPRSRDARRGGLNGLPRFYEWHLNIEPKGCIKYPDAVLPLVGQRRIAFHFSKTNEIQNAGQPERR